MDKFEITVRGEVLIVKPQYDETFEVYQNRRLIATLVPAVDALGVEWISTDLIANEYAQQIGAAIEMYHEI